MGECKIIFFSGIDGSGKTTLAKKLVSRLEDKGRNDVEYIWYRWTAFFSYPLLALCRFLGYTEKREHLTIRRYYKNRIIASLWSVIYPLDYALCALAKIRVKRRKNSIIVFDRFIPDIIADVTCQARIDILKTSLGRILLSLLNRNDLLGIIIDVDEETATARKDDIPSRKYVRFRRPIYLNLANAMGWKVLDGRRPPEENVREILKMMCVDPSE